MRGVQAREQDESERRRIATRAAYNGRGQAVAVSEGPRIVKRGGQRNATPLPSARAAAPPPPPPPPPPSAGAGGGTTAQGVDPGIDRQLESLAADARAATVISLRLQLEEACTERDSLRREVGRLKHSSTLLIEENRSLTAEVREARSGGGGSSRSDRTADDLRGLRGE